MGKDVQSYAAGFLGGCGGLIASHPLDTIRIRMVSRGVQKTYSNGVVAFLEILRKEKIRGVFKGMTHPLIGQAFINAIVFGVQDNVYRRLPEAGDSSLRSRITANGISGMIAGGVQTVVVCPMELMKIRMQQQGAGQQHESWTMRKMKLNSTQAASGEAVMQHYQGPLETTITAFRKQGLRKGLFRGWWVTLFREVPQFGIYFSTFTFLKAKMAEFRHKSEDSLGVLELSLAGGITGVVTWLWYPIDVVKTLYQSDGVPGKPLKYKGVMDCVVQHYNTRGWRGFWHAFGPTAVRGFLNSAVTLPVVTLLLQLMRPKEV